MRAGSFFKRVPLWGKAVSLMALAAGIAAAVAGSGIMGDNLVKVQDPITVVTAEAGGAVGVTFNDDLSFEVTAESYPGDAYILMVQVENETSVDQTHRLTLDYPDGFRFSTSTDITACSSLGQGAGITLTQENPNAFVFTATTAADGTGTTGEMEICVEILPQVLPGWYTIGGSTLALETDLTNVG